MRSKIQKMEGYYGQRIANGAVLDQLRHLIQRHDLHRQFLSGVPLRRPHFLDIVRHEHVTAVVHDRRVWVNHTQWGDASRGIARFLP
jgi:hypothetical protein